jgi:hypothetical protein
MENSAMSGSQNVADALIYNLNVVFLESNIVPTDKQTHLRKKCIQVRYLRHWQEPRLCPT